MANVHQVVESVANTVLLESKPVVEVSDASVKVVEACKVVLSPAVAGVCVSIRLDEVIDLSAAELVVL